MISAAHLAKLEERLNERLQSIEAAQCRILHLFGILFRQGAREMAAIDNLEANLAAQTTVVNGVLALCDQIHDQLVAIPNLDPRVQAVADQLAAQQAQIAAAITRDTIAATEPPAPPAPPVVTPPATS